MGLRRKLYGFDGRRHSLSIVFLDRGDPDQPVDTFLEVKRIKPLPLQMSSTLARDALRGRCPPKVLAGVPFTVFTTACAEGLWGASVPPWCEEALPLTAPAQVDQLARMSMEDAPVCAQIFEPLTGSRGMSCALRALAEWNGLPCPPPTDDTGAIAYRAIGN